MKQRNFDIDRTCCGKIMNWLCWLTIIFAVLYFGQAALEMNGIFVWRK